MAKWADYCISAKRFAPGTRHIQALRVHVDSGEKIGTAEVWSREQVVTAIERDQKTFMTIYKGTEGWKKGAQVHVVLIDGVKYLRTDKNKIKVDNLDELPDF